MAEKGEVMSPFSRIDLVRVGENQPLSTLAMSTSSEARTEPKRRVQFASQTSRSSSARRFADF